MHYYFIWNGTNSTNMGIRLQSMPQVVRPEERVSHVTIPGRAGELTLTEGSNIFESYIQTVPIVVDSLAHVKAAETWLKGSGTVTFCCEPERKQNARIINAVTFQKHSRNSSWWEAEVQFYCDPLKEAATTEEDIEITSSGTTVTNPGDVIARPLIVITGSGAITIRAGGQQISLTGVESGWQVDSDLEWVMDAQGNPLAGVYTGEFPLLGTGTKAVQFTGSVTKLTITPRWRYI